MCIIIAENVHRKFIWLLEIYCYINPFTGAGAIYCAHFILTCTKNFLYGLYDAVIVTAITSVLSVHDLKVTGNVYSWSFEEFLKFL